MKTRWHERGGMSRRRDLARLGALACVVAAIGLAIGVRQSAAKPGEWEVDVTLGMLHAALLAAAIVLWIVARRYARKGGD